MILSLKGSMSRDFDLRFFKPICAPDTQAKVFSNLVSISPRYSIIKLSPQCAAHRGDDLCGVHPFAECCTPRRRSPWCATHHGDYLRCLISLESRALSFKQISVECIPPRRRSPLCATCRKDKLHTPETTSKSSLVSGFL